MKKNFFLLTSLFALTFLWQSNAQYFSESFENAGAFPSGWTLTNGTNDWDIDQGNDNGPGSAQDGTYSAFFNDFDYSGGTEAEMITPNIDLSSATAPLLKFWYWDDGGADTVEVLVSTDGSTYTSEYTTPTVVSSWSEITVDLSAYAGNATVTISWKGTSIYGYDNPHVDNISIEEAPTCPAPSGLTLDNVTDTTANISWTTNGSETDWEIVVQADGTGAPSGSGTATTNNPYTAMSLTANTSYEVYVRAFCGVSDYSEWIGPLDFTTTCSIYTAPFTEDFESISSGQPDCWSIDGTTSSSSYHFSSYATGYSGRGMRFNSYYNSNGYTSELISPTIDASGLSSMRLKFYYKNPTGGNFEVLISTDGGSNYTSLETGLTGQTDWIEKTYDVTTYISSSIKLKFIGTSNYGSGDAYIYLDEVALEETPSCIEPSDITLDNVTSETAQISWTANNGESDWEIVVQADGTGTPSGSGTATTDNPYTAMSLSSNTAYEVYVRSSCGGDLSAWTGPLDFTTDCSTFTAPYTEDFDSTATGSSSNPTVPSCWSFIDEGVGYGYVNSTGANSFYMYNSYDSTGNYILVSPSTTDLSSGLNRVSFDVDGSTGQVLSLGTMSDATDPSTFTEIQAITLATDDYESYTITIPAGSDMHLAFKHGQTGTYDGYFLDNILIEPLPSCLESTDLTIDSFTDTEATISWTANNGETDWEIVVQAVGTGEPGASGTATTNNPYTASGLTSNTAYEVYIRAFCGGSDYSAWTGPVNFTTACSTLTPEYTQDFTTFLDACWEQAADGDLTSGPASTGSSNWYSEEFAHSTTSGGGAVNINIYGSNDIEWLLSPYFDLSAGGYNIVVDVALTDYNDTTLYDGFDTDDEVRLVYSTDGTNWVTLETWNQDNTPSVSGETVSFDISPLTDSNVQFAFYVAENTGGSMDIEFHIDNFNISAISPTDTADFINLQWPGTANIIPGGSFTAYAQIYEPGITDAAGQGANVEAWIGVSTTDATSTVDFLSSDWTWLPASYNTDSGNNDEYQASFGTTLPIGTYYYVSRFKVNGGPYSYGGNDISDGDGGNFWNGSSFVSGVLTVNPTPETTNHVASFSAVADSDTEITVTWNDNDGTQAAEGFLLVAKTGSATLYTPVDGTDATNDTDWSDDDYEVNIAPGVETYTFTGLTASTLYSFEIYPYTNSGSYIDYKTDATVPSANATTDADPCASLLPDYLEDFTTFVPDCWLRGEDGDLTSGPSSTNTTSGWIAEEFAHTTASGEGATNINIWQSGDVNWLLTPSFDLSADGYQVRVDAALTDYNDTELGDALSAGDVISLVYSNDGTNWTTLYDFATNIPAASGETVIVDLTGITGTTVQFAFYVSEGASGRDVDFHIDNFRVETIPVPVTYTFNGTWSPSDPSGDASYVDDIVVSSGNAIISSDTECDNVIINPGAAMTINSGATLTITDKMTLESVSNNFSNLMLEGNINGTVTYERYVNSTSNGNDLISPPLGGQTWASFLADGSNEADLLDDGNTSPTTYAFGPFDKTTDNWLNYTDASVVTLNSGTGYRAATNTGTTLTFTGAVETSIVAVNIEDTGANYPDWNLIGNPYTTYLDMADFLNYDLGDGTRNIDILEDISGIYGYDGSASNGWDVVTLANAGARDMAPGQGFFVAANDTFVAGYDITFAPSMRRVNSGDDFIAGRNSSALTYLKLNANTATNDYTTQFYFNDNASAGLDHGYDAKLWGDTPPSFSLYSNLVENNTGTPIALQALNSTDLTNIVIPLGVNASMGEQLTFTISETTLPSTIKVYLDDTENNTSTLLNTTDYVISPISDITGTGRFYLRFTEQALSTTDATFENIKIYTKASTKAIYIHGALHSDTNAKVYDIHGRMIHHSVLNTNTLVHHIDTSNFSDGVYIVTLSNGTQEKSQKVIIK